MHLGFKFLAKVLENDSVCKAIFVMNYKLLCIFSKDFINQKNWQNVVFVNYFT